ncbi:MAG TPA: riboflavin biosynthesis protein RibF [Firmicutes bacterium]|jgi:riboflavin kinase/FMN adenylyltransferase|nr:riboflavin biosynthesis protein RibF [Bacillota bacterium]
MIITQRFEALPNVPRVFALGNFDGVHLGHQALLLRAVERARELQGVAIAMGFAPHPLKVLGFPIETITTEAVKAQLLANLGLDVYFALPFTRQLAEMPPDDFVQAVLLEQAETRLVVVGFNYSFGRNAIGTPAYLQQLLQVKGISVDIVPPVMFAGEPVSSSRIRQCLRQGDLPAVQALLGRPYSISGVVQRGDQRGRVLGFPTANLYNLEGLALPPLGVYGVEVVGLGLGMANLGLRPTFPQAGPALEVHVLDYVGDLYGMELEVRLLKYIRPERQFEGLIDLKQQLLLDQQIIRDALGRAEY